MTNNGIVTIHGKEYMTVARRIELAHEGNVLESVETEIVNHSPIVIRARIVVNGKVFTGISAVDPNNARTIEKENPYEVAETSAVGRALGFAGFGVIESVASADEMARASSPKEKHVAIAPNPIQQTSTKDVLCEVCGKPAIEKKGTTKGGKAYHAIFCSTEEKGHTRWLWN